MFGDDVPLAAPSLTINSDGSGAPGIVMRNFGDGSITIQVRGPNDELMGDFVISDGKLASPVPKTLPTSGGGGSGGANCFPGFVVSGSGDTYQVSIYLTGLSGSATEVSVRQLLISNGVTYPIPAGAGVIVTKNGGNYYMQYPTWT